MKNGTPVFGGTSIPKKIPKKAIPKKKIQKNKFRLNVEDNTYCPTTMSSTTARNDLSLLTVFERQTCLCKIPKLTNNQRLYLQQHQEKDGTLEIGAITKAGDIF